MKYSQVLLDQQFNEASAAVWLRLFSRHPAFVSALQDLDQNRGARGKRHAVRATHTTVLADIQANKVEDFELTSDQVKALRPLRGVTFGEAAPVEGDDGSDDDGDGSDKSQPLEYPDDGEDDDSHRHSDESDELDSSEHRRDSWPEGDHGGERMHDALREDVEQRRQRRADYSPPRAAVPPAHNDGGRRAGQRDDDDDDDDEYDGYSSYDYEYDEHDDDEYEDATRRFMATLGSGERAHELPATVKRALRRDFARRGLTSVEAPGRLDARVAVYRRLVAEVFPVKSVRDLLPSHAIQREAKLFEQQQEWHLLALLRGIHDIVSDERRAPVLWPGADHYAVERAVREVLDHFITHKLRSIAFERKQ